MSIQVIRATETWQQTGAYYVRIQGMARQHNISLRQEFDEHDTPSTEYIVLTDNDFPIATCRFYELNKYSAMIGRVVVLPEYRDKGLGKKKDIPLLLLKVVLLQSIFTKKLDIL